MNKIIIQSPRDEKIIFSDICEYFNNHKHLSSKYNHELLELVAEYCAQNLNINNVNIDFNDNLKYTEGDFGNNMIEISSKKLVKSEITDMLISLTHEMRHQYQAKINKDKKKKLNYCTLSTLPIKSCSGLINFLKSPSDEFTMFSYYITATNEKDARDFSNNFVRSLYLDLIIKNPINKNINKLYFEKQVNKINKEIIRENNNYAYHINNVNKSKYLIPNFVTSSLIDISKNKTLHNDSHYTGVIKEYLSLCANDKTKKIALEIAYKCNDSKCVLMCLNHKNTNIIQEDFNNFFDYNNSNNDKIKLEDIKAQLTNWNEKDIDNINRLYNNIKDKNSKIEVMENF